MSEIERVLAGNALVSSGARSEHGEWDWLPHVDRRTIRRLTGAGYFARRGVELDVAADLIIARVPGVETFDDAIEWYVTTALRELDERQAARRGEVRWEDQERPDDSYTFEPDDETVEVVVDMDVEMIDVDVCYELDREPAFVLPAGTRATFYGSDRSALRVSVWDSMPDDGVRRRVRRHGSTWWAVCSWLRRHTLGVSMDGRDQ